MAAHTSPGDYSDCTLALWSTATYELVSSARLLESMHGVAFSPWDARELTCVGTGTVAFWFLQQRGADVTLQVPGPARVLRFPRGFQGGVWQASGRP